jgi:hypothetical protein
MPPVSPERDNVRLGPFGSKIKGREPYQGVSLHRDHLVLWLGRARIRCARLHTVYAPHVPTEGTISYRLENCKNRWIHGNRSRHYRPNTSVDSSRQLTISEWFSDKDPAAPAPTPRHAVPTKAPRQSSTRSGYGAHPFSEGGGCRRGYQLFALAKGTPASATYPQIHMSGYANQELTMIVVANLLN